MTAYRQEDERAIRTGRRVDDWTQSGLLTPEQRSVLLPQLAVELRRTNKFLRITLFLFGGVILHSALGLFALFLSGTTGETTAALLCVIAGGACFWLASQLVRRYHLYRFGVEEVAALTAAGLVATGAALFVGGDSTVVVGLAVAATMLAVLFLHFGFVYAAVLAMVAAAALPFQFASESEVLPRAIAIVVLAAIAVMVRRARSEYGDEYPGDVLTVIEACAWLGVYLLVNLVASGGLTRLDRASSFYWVTFAVIWLLPAAGLWWSLRGRERPLLLVSLVMALGTLLSSKAYLGAPSYEWDPIVFGLLLIVIAGGVRRWLSSGEGGMRHGYTASRILQSDQAALGSLAMVSAVHTDVPVAPSAAAPDSAIGGGGRSGGAGAGGAF